jgi:hypothetical protein
VLDEDASAHVAIPEPVLSRESLVGRVVHEQPVHEAAQDARIDEPPHRLGQRVVALDQVGHADEILAAGNLRQLTGIRERRGERLLDEHVPAGMKCRRCLPVVEPRRRGDIHEVDIRGREKRFGSPRLRMQFLGSPLGGSGVDVGDTGDAHARQPSVLRHRKPREGSTTNQPYAERLGADDGTRARVRLVHGRGHGGRATLAGRNERHGTISSKDTSLRSMSRRVACVRRFCAPYSILRRRLGVNAIPAADHPCTSPRRGSLLEMPPPSRPMS